MLTHVFQNGDSLAVHIPNALHFAKVGQYVEIELAGDALILRSVAQAPLTDIGEILAMFSPSFMADDREFNK